EHARWISLEVRGGRQRRRRILDPCPREDHDHAMSRLDLARLFHLAESGERGRRFGTGPDALEPGEEPLRLDDGALAHRVWMAARLAHDAQHLASRERPGHAQPWRVGDGILPEARGLRLVRPRLHEGGAALRLHGNEARLRRLDPAQRGQLLESLPDPYEAGAAARGIHENVRDIPPELLAELEPHRLLALETVGLLQGGEIEPADLCGHAGDELAGGCNGAVHGED